MLQEEQTEKIENSGKTKKVIKTSTGLIVIFVAVVLFFGGAMTYWYYNDPNSYDSSKDSTQVASAVNSNTNASNTNVNGNANVNANTNSSSATADWKTYENTKYGYSFKYPTGTKVYSYGPPPGDRVDVTATSSVANVQLENKEGLVFEVRASDISDTSASSINTHFGTTNMDIKEATLGGIKAYYIVNSSDQNIYFIRKTASAPVLEITLLRTDKDAETILSSLQFTK